jgi:hypothetical protein
VFRGWSPADLRELKFMGSSRGVLGEDHEWRQGQCPSSRANDHDREGNTGDDNDGPHEEFRTVFPLAAPPRASRASTSTMRWLHHVPHPLVQHHVSGQVLDGSSKPMR